MFPSLKLHKISINFWSWSQWRLVHRRIPLDYKKYQNMSLNSVRHWNKFGQFDGKFHRFYAYIWWYDMQSVLCYNQFFSQAAIIQESQDSISLHNFYSMFMPQIDNLYFKGSISGSTSTPLWRKTEKYRNGRPPSIRSSQTRLNQSKHEVYTVYCIKLQ